MSSISPIEPPLAMMVDSFRFRALSNISVLPENQESGTRRKALDQTCRHCLRIFGLFHPHYSKPEWKSCGKVKPPRNRKIHIRVTRNLNGRVAGRLSLPAIAKVVDYLK